MSDSLYTQAEAGCNAAAKLRRAWRYKGKEGLRRVEWKKRGRVGRNRDVRRL